MAINNRLNGPFGVKNKFWTIRQFVPSQLVPRQLVPDNWPLDNSSSINTFRQLVPYEYNQTTIT